MAGFFIDVAVIYSNVIGSVFSGSDPAWGKFLGAVVFSIAVLLISLVGMYELYRVFRWKKKIPALVGYLTASE